MCFCWKNLSRLLFFPFCYFFIINKSISVRKYVCAVRALFGNDLMLHYFPRPSGARGSGRLYAVGRNQPSPLENSISNVSNLQSGSLRREKAVNACTNFLSWKWWLVISQSCRMQLLDKSQEELVGVLKCDTKTHNLRNDSGVCWCEPVGYNPRVRRHHSLPLIWMFPNFICNQTASYLLCIGNCMSVSYKGLLHDTGLMFVAILHWHWLELLTAVIKKKIEWGRRPVLNSVRCESDIWRRVCRLRRREIHRHCESRVAENAHYCRGTRLFLLDLPLPAVSLHYARLQRQTDQDKHTQAASHDPALVPSERKHCGKSSTRVEVRKYRFGNLLK